MKHIGIGFVTGRRHFQTVLKSYLNNWLEQGLIDDQSIRLNLFIAYDLKYHKTKISDYKSIPADLAKMVESINFYGKTVVDNERSWIKSQKILTDEESKLIFGDGYAKKRNLVLYFAIKNRMDNLIFIDDDEYPIAVMKNQSDNLIWMGQSVVGTHLKYISEANITHGHHCGYISPIPYMTFNDILKEADFKKFIQAISNDIITWEKIKTTVIENHGVTFANPEIINESQSYEVSAENGMKFISGGNLCINLQDFRNLPPFYNPPGARGEDTFLSTALSDLKVVKVPCYTFHDGFMMYNHILSGVLPTSLNAINFNSAAVTKRFVNATIGWIRYKPLLVYITQRAQFARIMDEIEKNLKETIPKLGQYFKTPEFSQVLDEFYFFAKRVAVHHEEFTATKKAWSKLLASVE